MRPSEENRTAKSFSASRTDTRFAREGRSAEAIKGPAVAAVAWIARIRSPLLLKTASVIPARMRALARCLLFSQYNGVRAR